MIAGCYARKSQEDDRSADAQSTQRQIDRAREFAKAKGWTFSEDHIWIDNGVSGAEWKDRHAFNALLDVLEGKPPIQVLIVSELSRIGRDTVRTPFYVNQIEEAGVQIFGYLSNQQISLADETSEISTVFNSLAASFERRRASQRITDALRRRAERGLVAGGRAPYGYENYRDGDVVKRRVREDQAAVVRRIFEATRDGKGLHRIAKELNAEKVPAPSAGRTGGGKYGEKWSGIWTPTAVKEILRQERYLGVEIYGRTKRVRRKGTKERVKGTDVIRVEQPAELRIIDDVLWNAAHAAKAGRRATFLTRGNQLVGQVENLTGRYLLSSHLVCGLDRPDGKGICGEPLLAVKRGRNQVLSYTCRAHRDRGDAACTNNTAVPADLIHRAIVFDLNHAFSTETFTEHLRQLAADDGARAARQRERGALLDRLPEIAIEESRVANAIAAGAGLDVLVEKLKDLKAEREAAEKRISQIQADERDIRVEADAVERLRDQWESWQKVLHEATGQQASLKPGEQPDQLPEAVMGLARQILRKVLLTSIEVRPAADARAWFYRGAADYNGVLRGVAHENGRVIVMRVPSEKTPVAVAAYLAERRPIAGGSDAGCNDVLGRDMAPHTPPHSRGPGEAVSPLDHRRRRGGRVACPHTPPRSPRPGQAGRPSVKPARPDPIEPRHRSQSTCSGSVRAPCCTRRRRSARTTPG